MRCMIIPQSMPEVPPELVLYLVQQGLEEYPGMLLDQDLQEAASRLYRNITQHGGTAVFLYVQEEGYQKLVGAYSWDIDEDPHYGEVFSVQWLYLVRTHRGSLGSVLLRHAVETARVLGCQKLSYSKMLTSNRVQVRYMNVPASRGAAQDGQQDEQQEVSDVESDQESRIPGD